jgi:PAS domain S-box-containing protein
LGHDRSGQLRQTVWSWYPANPTADIDSRLMSRALGAIGIAGSALALLWVFAPSPAQSDLPAIAILALITAGLSALSLAGLLDSQPRVVFEMLVALATVIVSLGSYFAHARGTGLPFLYLWCVPYAYWFFPRRRALLQSVIIVLGFAAATVASSHGDPRVAGSVGSDWGPVLLLAGTVLIIGELVRRLGMTIAAARARFTRAFAQAPAPMARVDLRGVYTDANDAFCRAVGRSREEVVGLAMSAMAPPEQWDMVGRRSENLFSGRTRIEQFEHDYLRPDGSRVTMVSTNSLLGEPGDPDRELFIQAIDITDRKRAEQALGESERRYRTLVETAQAIVWSADTEGHLTFVNDAARSVLGYEPEWALGRDLVSVLPEEHREAWLPVLEQLKAGGSVSGEAAHRRRDGRRIIGSYSIAALRDEHGAVSGFVGTLLDVTERRRATEALRVSEARLRALIENAPAAITLCDSQGMLTGLNPEAARVLGAAPEQLLGRSFDGLDPATDAETARRSQAAVIAGEEPALRELSLTLDDGEHIFLSAAFPLPAGRDEEPTICRISFDITDREQARRALVRSHDERRRLLAELVRAQEDERRRIAADVHDESIQVLAGVAIRLGLLTGMLDHPEQHRLIDGLDDAVRSGIKSLRQLLFDLRLPALDELGLAAAVRSYLSETLPREGATYTLDDRLEQEPAPELRTVLYRVAQEALSNVRKHAQARHVEVTLSGTSYGYRVTVRDDGIGFDPAAQDGELPGHLGLVGMRERVEAAGGWIEMHSQPSEGTTVEFGVPLEAGLLASTALPAPN